MLKSFHRWELSLILFNLTVILPISLYSIKLESGDVFITLITAVDEAVDKARAGRAGHDDINVQPDNNTRSVQNVFIQ